MSTTHAHALPATAERTRLHCAFCGKDADHVRFLAAGISGDAICERCAVVAFFIMVKAWCLSAFRFSGR